MIHPHDVPDVVGDDSNENPTRVFLLLKGR